MTIDWNSAKRHKFLSVVSQMGYSTDLGNELRHEAETLAVPFRTEYMVLTNMGSVMLDMQNLRGDSLMISATLHPPQTAIERVKATAAVKTATFDVLRELGVTRVYAYEKTAMESKDHLGLWTTLDRCACAPRRLKKQFQQLDSHLLSPLQDLPFSIQHIISTLRGL